MIDNRVAYPALIERSTGTVHALDRKAEFIVGRSQTASLPILDRQCSRQQFKISYGEGKFSVTPLSENAPTYCNSVKLSAAKSLTHGSVIQAGASIFVFAEHDAPALSNGDILAVAQYEATLVGPAPPPVPSDQTMMLMPNSGKLDLSIDRSIPISGEMLIGRDKERAAIYLPHAQVSRIHAQITLRNQSAVVSDLNSANGTFVNGRRISVSTKISPGDHINVGPYALTFDGKCLHSRSRVNNVELACRGLTRVVKNRETGDAITLLDEITLVIQPREFVCLLGPSGSGKSTLLSALSARTPAEHGRVTINGEDLYANFDALKQDIAVVPQKDVLHDSLTVQTALKFTARLRLPPDTTDNEIGNTVNDMLDTVSLTNRANTVVRNLSGGQLKRASLANEIVSKPSLLFLDEVTSGLDEQTDADMMNLFRKIADDGKTVICVTHSLAHVEKSCHRIVVLAEGGKLAFVGTPDEALEYFGIERLGEVYEKLSTQPPEEWKTRFRKSDAYQRHVGCHFNTDSDLLVASIARLPRTFADHVDIFKRQTKLLTQRYLQIQLADRLSVLMMIGQCLLVGLLIVLLFGNISDGYLNERIPKTSSILFLMAISVFWFGCSNSAKEIVKESVIYSRERDVNQLVASYLASKFIVLGAASLIQTTILYWIVSFGTSVETEFVHYVFLATLSAVGVSLGLLISALSQSTDMAVTIVPLVLIPQIIFSGAISAVTGLAKTLACLFIVVYWTYGGLLKGLPEESTTLLGYEDWSVAGSWFMLMLHGTAYLGLTYLALDAAGRRDAVYGRAIDKLIAGARARITTPPAAQRRPT